MEKHSNADFGECRWKRSLTELHRERVSIADIQGECALKQSIADIQGECARKQSIADIQGECARNQSIADIQGECTQKQSIANIQGECTQKQSIADIQGECTQKQSIADIQGECTQKQSIADIQGECTQKQSIADIQGESSRKQSNVLPGNSCSSCQEIKLYNKYHYLMLQKVKCQHTGFDCCCAALWNESLLPSLQQKVDNEVIQNSKEVQDLTSDNSYTRHPVANDEELYRCHVCRRYEKAGEDYQDGGDGINKEVASTLIEGQKKHDTSRRLDSEQHEMTLERKVDDIASIAEVGKEADNQKKVAIENLCWAAQYIINSRLSYKHLGTLESFLKLILLPDQTNHLDNGHHSTQNFKDLTLSSFEAGKKQIKDKMTLVNALTKQRRKYAIAVGKDTVPFDASRQVIVASYMEDDGSVQEVLISAGRISSHSAGDAFDYVTKCCADYFETKDIVSVCTDEASNCTGRHTIVFDRMKLNPLYSDKIIHLPDLCHRTELLLKNSLPMWLQKTLSDANTIGQTLTMRSALSQKLMELSSASSEWIFFPLTSNSETRYFEHSHQLVDFILKNLGLLLHFLPILLDAPDLKHICHEVTVIYTIIGNPVFACNLLCLNAVFVEAANLRMIVQDHNFSPSDFVKIVKDFRKFLDSRPRKLPPAVGKLVETGTFEYTYSYLERKRNVTVEFCDQNQNFMKDRYFQWMRRLSLDFDSYIEIPEAVKKSSDFFDMENVDENYKVKLFKFMFQTYAIDFCSCGSQCGGLDGCLCADKECQLFFGLCKKHPENCTENGKFAPTKFFGSMLFLRTRHLKIPNIYRLIEFFALLKSNQSSRERVRSVIASTVDRHLETCSQDPPSATPDMTEMMVFLQTNLNMLVADFQDVVSISLKSRHQEAHASTHNEVQQGTVVTLTRRKTTETELEKDQKKLDPLSSGKKMKLNDGSVSSCSPTSQPSLQVTDPSSVSSQSRKPPSAPQHHLPESAPSTPAASVDVEPSAPSTHLPQSAPRVALPVDIEEGSTNLFCVCLEGPEKSPDEAFVRCSRGIRCLSRRSRLRLLRVGGGSWFHKKCLGLQGAPKGNWICSPCRRRKMVLCTVQPEKTA